MLSAAFGDRGYSEPTNNNGLAGHARISCRSNEQFGAVIKVGLQHHELLDCVTDLDRTYHILQHSFVLSSLDSLWGKGGTLNRQSPYSWL